MLVDPQFVEEDHQMKTITNLIARTNGNSIETIKIQDGIYEIGHFNFNHVISNIKDEYTTPLDSDFCFYGICDDHKQILEQCSELENDPNRKFVISMTPVEKSKQSPSGGWRWHKWGPYIGAHKPQHEHLYDEPNIDKVYIYHIYEIE